MPSRFFRRNARRKFRTRRVIKRRPVRRLRRTRKFVKRVVRSMAEKKFTLRNLTKTLDLSASANYYTHDSLWTEPVVGAGTDGVNRTTRIGACIDTNRLTVRMVIRYNSLLETSTIASGVWVRIVVFTWRCTPIASPVLSDFYIPATYGGTVTPQEAITAPFETTQIRVIKSWLFRVDAINALATNTNNGVQIGKHIEFSIPWRKRMIWEQGGADLATTKKEPYILINAMNTQMAGSATAQNLRVDISSKMSFIDL